MSVKIRQAADSVLVIKKKKKVDNSHWQYSSTRNNIQLLESSRIVTLGNGAFNFVFAYS